MTKDLKNVLGFFLMLSVHFLIVLFLEMLDLSFALNQPYIIGKMYVYLREADVEPWNLSYASIRQTYSL